jgi:tRNA (adenine57-N1/adenine58-N1)-methyltransferase catalytic subunit
MKQTVEQNDIAVLIDENLRKIMVDTSGKTDKIRGIGVIDPKTLVGKIYGEKLLIGSKQFWLLVPSMQDKLQGIHRQAQIILPRDAAHILMNCAIEPGQTVLEAGIGSGSLTIALASVVGPQGQVISYDIREEFIEHAMTNLKQAALTKNVITKIKDVTEGIDESDLDAIILDIPNPWAAVEHAWKTLKIGGYLCTYSPLISQVEQTVRTIEHHPFIECKTYENIQREMIVSKHGTRPSFEMLGHTGYLTFARKVLFL